MKRIKKMIIATFLVILIR